MITVQLEPDGPITELDEDFLVRRDGVFENDDELTTWVEYRLASDRDNPRAVHRSVHVKLKKPMVESVGEIGQFS
jgi:hypothetical protein